jgi:hypothetical protein
MEVRKFELSSALLSSGKLKDDYLYIPPRKWPICGGYKVDKDLKIITTKVMKAL